MAKKVANERNERLYSPKHLKATKFVGHASLQLEDFGRNETTFRVALNRIAKDPSAKPELRAQAEGYYNVSETYSFGLFKISGRLDRGRPYFIDSSSLAIVSRVGLLRRVYRKGC